MGKHFALPHGISERSRFIALAFAVVAGAAGSASPTPAMAEAQTVRVAIQPGATYLPLLMMKHHKLIEKHAQQGGLGTITATWAMLGSGAAVNDGLIAGQLDFAGTGTPPAITLWARTRNTAQVKGVAAFSDVAQYLLTTNPNVKSLQDFTEKDRIALPAVKVSLQAVTLQIAAAKAFGDAHYAKLDHLTVSMRHPDAMIALLSGKSEITAHFSNPPFMFKQLQDPRVHKVLSSFDVFGGPASNGVIVAPSAFRRDNPRLYRVFLAALDDAIGMIRGDLRGAARVYLAESKDKEPEESLLKMLSSPDVAFTAVPHNTMVFADFMFRRGLIPVRPQSWKDLFYPEIHDRPGS
ncbi:MAG: ABC transporter substrate-binding protein [Betaproteobacteria bacterium]|nr:ABC transporter substrate-binding protein [Betaproteobacteria bacterium]